MKLLQKNKVYLILGIIILVACGLRIYNIDRVPPVMSHDELDYINNGYSIYKTGRDLYGNFLPLTVGGTGLTAIPSYISAVLTVIAPLNPLTARLPVVLFGAIETLLLFLISRKLFKSEIIGVLAAAILALSNWGIMISRMMFDPPIALFLFLLGICIFFYAKTLPRLILSLSIISLGFLSYYGTVFIYIPVVCILFWYRREVFLRDKRHLLSSGLVVFLALLIFVIMVVSGSNRSMSVDRVSEFIFSNPQKLSDQVILDRENSTAPKLLNSLFVNKGTVLFKEFLNNYVGAFSPIMIFVQGDPNRIYGLWDRGELSLLDLPLILIGIYMGLKKFRRESILILLLILAAPLTSAFSGTYYATRAFLMWPFLIIFAGTGAFYIFKYLSGKSRVVFATAFIICYLFMFFSQIYQYYFRYPVYAGQIWFDADKQFADYLMAHSNEKLVIYSPEARQQFMEYFFYAGLNPEEVQRVLDKNDISGDIHFRNFLFTNRCTKPTTQLSKTDVAISNKCNVDMSGADEVIKTADLDHSVVWALYFKKGYNESTTSSR